MERTIGRYLDNSEEFFRWVNGSAWSLVALNVIVESGLLDELGDEPLSIAELAGNLHLPAGKVARLVSFLAAHEIVELDDDECVTGTERTDMLRDLANVVRIGVVGVSTGAYLYPALQQGMTAFELRHGKPAFDYLADNLALGGLFASFMGLQTRRMERFLFNEHRFGSFAAAVDVGGSHGDFLLRLLQEYPDARGVLFDLPGVLQQAQATIAAHPLADRIELVGGSFFEKVPPGDLYLLKQIIHDWNDAEAIEILKTIRKAILPGGRIALIDHILAERPSPTEGQFTDMAMLVWATGHERRLSEVAGLLEEAGFRIDRVSENPQGQSVIEAVPV